MESTNHIPSVMSTNDLIESKSEGWKWDVNHDGVIWSWYHEYPNSSSNICKVVEISTDKLSDTGSVRQRYSLVDYWYIVHDGPVIPTSTEY